MTSIASLTQAVDNHANNVDAMFDAMLNAKDRELGEIDAEQSRAIAALDAEKARITAEYEARKERCRDERAKISGWGLQTASDIRTILEGEV